LKKYRYSLIFILFLLATSPFHLQVSNLLLRTQVFNSVNYLLLGVMAAFFVLAFFKALASGKVLENAALLLAAAIVFYLLFQRRIFLNRAFFSNFLHIAEFFLLGVILARENKRAASVAPFLVLFASAFAFELIQVFFHSRVIDANDIWMNGIAGLVGMVVGFI